MDFGLAGALPPGLGGRHRNPALSRGIEDPRLQAKPRGVRGDDLPGQGPFLPFEQRSAPARCSFLSAFALPVGILGMLRPESNPFLYSTDPEAFRSSFDLLTFLDQAARFWLFLLDPPESPENVTISVSNDDISISGGDGEPIWIGTRPGNQGISLFATPLIPPPILGVFFNLGPLVLETGLFLGGGDTACLPNESLEKVLMGDPVESDTEYTLFASSALQAGCSQSVTWMLPVTRGATAWKIQAAVRGVVFYAVAAARVELRTGMRTGSEGFPQEYFADGQLFHFQPGSGYGIGGRIDAGLTATRDRLLIGLGILNILGASIYSGLRHPVDRAALADSDGCAETFLGSRPEAIVHLAWLIPAGRQGAIVLMSDGGYAGVPTGHAALSLRMGRLLLDFGAGWAGAFLYEASAGLLFNRWILQAGFSAFQAPFSGEMVHGLGLSIARRPRGGG